MWGMGGMESLSLQLLLLQTLGAMWTCGAWPWEVRYQDVMQPAYSLASTGLWLPEIQVPRK